MTNTTNRWVPFNWDQRRRNLALVTVIWTIAVAGAAWWLFHERVRGYREQTFANAGVRLTGIKDTLAITFRQLAALPLDLAHRPAIPALLALQEASAGAAGAAPRSMPDVQPILDRMGTDFGLPFVALIDRRGRLLASTTLPRAPDAAASQASRSNAGDVSGRDYFLQAMSRGSAMQFLLGRNSRLPGLYFASRVDRDGEPLGVTLVKQETETLNRLLSDADGSVIFMTDSNGVLVLGNQPGMLLQRLPSAPTHSDADWDAVYQRVPAPLPWHSSRWSEGGRSMSLTAIGDMPHITLSTPLGDTPFKAWVLMPLDDEPGIFTSTWTSALAIWLAGALLIWLSWRRLQLLDAALNARREIFELTQGLPLTVFRYHVANGAKPRFAFLGRGIGELFGIDAAAVEKDPSLPWRLADGSDRPPTHPQEFMVKRGDESAWLLADSTPQLEEDGSTTYNGYWLDITMRRETQARFAAVFEHAAAGYLFFDAKRGITHCNAATLALFGTNDAQRVLGRIPWFPGLSTDQQADGRPSRQRALDDMRRHTRAGDRVHSFEWRFQRLDGTPFDADVSVIALEWQGTPQFCAIVQDITLRKATEAAMQAARAAAEAASQTKSSFLANMSHELRTPMNAIIGMTHLALEDGLPDKQRDYIEKAHGSARNLLQILNDILDVSKIEAGQLDLERIDFELESVIGDMADVLGMKADEKGLELLFTASPDLPRRMVGDPSRLRQVLVNLGGNAIKFTDRGEVTVGMELVPPAAGNGVGTEDTIELHGWVRDTGVGMSEEDLTRLFQPFVQGDSSTTRRFGGTGLGLVISRQLVERMGGKLWVESKPGKGSTFHFTARLGRSTPRAPARAWMANELRGRRALLVDDNAAALDVLGDMLSTLGIAVDRATNGEDALALFERNASRYTWCLLDWKMPGMDGVELARRILAHGPQTRAPTQAPGQMPNHMPAQGLVHPCILLVTAFARDEALRASAQLPLSGVLHKPITPSSLHDCLVQARRAEPALASPLPAPTRRPSGAPRIDDAVRLRLTGAHILLVEDHPLNQQLACELLRRAGMNVTVANDGSEALQKLEHEGPFDGVLMDCQMPVMDGYTATRALRADPKWRTLPVIAMTASALVEDRERALASGMNAHITKPIHVDLMLRTMAEWIGSGPAGQAEPNEPAEQKTSAAEFAAAALSVRSPPGPPPGLTLGSTPGLTAVDTAAGLAYCMGNQELYLRLLQGFRTEQSAFAVQLVAELDAGKRDAAVRRVHNLKGLAGTIGAHRLSALASTFHRVVLAGDSVNESLAELVDELDVVLRELDHVLPPH